MGQVRRHTCILAFVLMLASLVGACGSPGPGAGSVASPSGRASMPVATEAPARPTSPKPLASASPPEDFAFVFDSNPCGIGRIDTFLGTFKQGELWNPRDTIPLELSREEIAGIYGTMRAIDIFTYPRTYEISLPPNGMHGHVVPAPTYYLKVRAGGRTTEVSWHDEITRPNPPEARKLRALMRLIEGTVAARPEVKTYDEAAAGCAYRPNPRSITV